MKNILASIGLDNIVHTNGNPMQMVAKRLGRSAQIVDFLVIVIVLLLEASLPLFFLSSDMFFQVDASFPTIT